MPAAFCAVPTHLVGVIRTYRQWPRLQATPSSTWGFPFQPFHVAVSRTGEVFMTGLSHHSVHAFSAAGVELRQWGGRGFGAGKFNNPHGLAVADGGEVVVADSDNHRVQVFRADGTFIRLWDTQGRGGKNTYSYPRCVAVTKRGEVVVAEYGTARVQVFRLSDGLFLHQWKFQEFVSDPADVHVTAHDEVW